MRWTDHRRWAGLLSGIVGLAVLGFSPLAAQQSGTDWPQFRGPSGMGTSPDKGVPHTWSQKDNLVWKIPMPNPGASTPVILGDKIFLTTYSGYNVPGQGRGDMSALKRQVVCLNRADGKILWSKDVAAKLPEQESIRESHGYSSNTPVVDAERVYVFFGKSGVLAFDHDGKQLWQADVGSKLNGWGSAASPILHGDLVIVNASVESESLVALDKRSGKEKWRAKGIKEAWNTPLLVPVDKGKTELVVPIQGKVLGFDPATGTQLWTCDTGISWYMVPCVVAENGIIYCIGGRSGGALAVRAGGRGDVTKTHRLWTGNKGSNVSSPILHKGHLYWMHEGLGVAYCAELKSGKVVYEQRIQGAGQVYAAAVLADEKLYYVTRQGKTFVIAAKPEFEQLAVNDLADGSTFNASPAISGGRLFLRSDRFLYCVGKK
jgi:outer membrane protein assembly factor BamB